jgi:hypothetical protein
MAAVDWHKLLLTEIGDKAFKAVVKKRGLKNLRIAQTDWKGETIGLLPDDFWQDVLAECQRQVSIILRRDRELTRAERDFLLEFNEAGFLRKKGRPGRRFDPLEGAERWIRLRVEELHRAGKKRGAREQAAEELAKTWQSVGRDYTAQQFLDYMRRSKNRRTK